MCLFWRKSRERMTNSFSVKPRLECFFLVHLTYLKPTSALQFHFVKLNFGSNPFTPHVRRLVEHEREHSCVKLNALLSSCKLCWLKPKMVRARFCAAQRYDRPSVFWVTLKRKAKSKSKLRSSEVHNKVEASFPGRNVEKRRQNNPKTR